MKNLLKKSFAILCAVMLLLTCSITAMAASTDGVINIKNGVDGTVYNAYQIATLESYTGTSYSYKLCAGWEAFVAEGGAGAAYLEVNSDGYLVEKAGLGASDYAALAKAALVYATTDSNNIQVANTATAGADGTCSITGLDEGYFVVDSTLGTICHLNSTTKVVTIEEKNSKPSVSKKVEEDSNTGVYTDKNDADIDQVINFQATITVGKGAENYVLFDKMDDGLSFIEISSVKVGGVDVATTNYVADTNATAEYTFKISFTNEYTATLAENTEIVVSYTAKLNENAIAGVAEKNIAWVTYGDTNNDTNITEESTTETFMYSFDLVKYATIEGEMVLLDGAEFELYKTVDGDDKIEVVMVEEGKYRVAKEDETGVAIKTKDGVAVISGLDSATYYLEETKAPEGYNLLKGRQSVTINGENNSATFTDGEYIEGGVTIENKSGNILPSTGSFGTTMFILIGGGVALMAAVLLVTKKRMAKIAD